MSVTRSNIRAGQIRRVVVQKITDGVTDNPCYEFLGIKEGSLKISTDVHETILHSGVIAPHGVTLKGELEAIDYSEAWIQSLESTGAFYDSGIELVLEGDTAADTMIFVGARITASVKKSFSRKEPNSLLMKWSKSFAKISDIFAVVRDYSSYVWAIDPAPDFSTANFDYAIMPNDFVESGGARPTLPTMCRYADFKDAVLTYSGSNVDLSGRYFEGADFTGATMPTNADSKAKFKALVAGYDSSTLWTDGSPITS